MPAKPLKLELDFVNIGDVFNKKITAKKTIKCYVVSKFVDDGYTFAVYKYYYNKNWRYEMIDEVNYSLHVNYGAIT